MHHRAKPERFYLSQNVSQFSKKKPRIFKLFKSTVARKHRNWQELADLNSHPRWENVTTAIQMPAGLLWIFLLCCTKNIPNSSTVTRGNLCLNIPFYELRLNTMQKTTGTVWETPVCPNCADGCCLYRVHRLAGKPKQTLKCSLCTLLIKPGLF